ncbi:hypothetical protein AAE02nite_40550 [Adhaeribacter aerolatus]|uniref:Uncharacterized protein n=1 Tax=Adhaeribacter aerolatus TaxID=670289 RepID=A0A512B368_9BACT|nr:hypothetical protein [Adhaeribacter aerolatus]GEO06391.1 hypothetical protein AAE02nite_40550 [Adhaeribacter aerolatus]
MVKLFQTKGKKAGLVIVLLAISVSLVWAQNFSRQGISFMLYDKTGKPLTDAVIKNFQYRVYSLRDPKTVTDPHLSFEKDTNLFTFTESAVSPGISLAFISPTDTMYVQVFGRSKPDKVIDGITVQKGSYVLTSNEFSGNKRLKVENWSDFLEDEESVDKQDLNKFSHILRDKKPVSIVKHNH